MGSGASAEAAKDAPDETRVAQLVEYLDGRTIRLRSAHWGGACLYAAALDYTRETQHILVHNDPNEPTSNKKDFLVERVPGTSNQIRLRSVHWAGGCVYAASGQDHTPETRRVLMSKDPEWVTTTKKDWQVELVPGTTDQIRLRNAHFNFEYMYAAQTRGPTSETRCVFTYKNVQGLTSTKKDWTVEVVPDLDATAKYADSLAGSIIRLKSVHWNQEYMYAAAISHTPDTRHVCTHKDPNQPTTDKKDWLVERVPGTTTQIRLRSVYWNFEYLYTAHNQDPTPETRRVLVHKDPTQPETTKKDWEVELVEGTTDQIRLRNVYWNQEYLYTAAMDLITPETRPVLTYKGELTSNKNIWQVEVVSTDVEADQYLEECVAGLEHKTIRLRNAQNGLYLYAAGVDFSPETKHVLVHKDPNEPTSNKKDWVVQRVPGTRNQIRLRSVHWNHGYLYPAMGQDPTPETRRVLMYKDPAGLTSNKKDWEVELVPGTTNQIRLRNMHFNREYMFATETDLTAETQLVATAKDAGSLTGEHEQRKDWRLEIAGAPAAPQPKPDEPVPLSPPRQPSVIKVGAAMLTEVDDEALLSSLSACMETKAEWLGKGADVAGYAAAEEEGVASMEDFVPYSKLEIARAWHVQHRLEEGRYGLATLEVEQHVAELSAGVTSFTPVTHEKAAGLGIELNPSLNEAVLFHGTKKESLLQILSSGLNERYSGGAFGNGTYLAEDAGKADQYAAVDAGLSDFPLHKAMYSDGDHPGDVCYMLVCQVLLGEPIITVNGTSSTSGGEIFANAETQRELACVPNTEPPFSYHSMVVETGEAVKRYREYVCFHSDRILIKYLIAYRRV